MAIVLNPVMSPENEGGRGIVINNCIMYLVTNVYLESVFCTGTQNWLICVNSHLIVIVSVYSTECL